MAYYISQNPQVGPNRTSTLTAKTYSYSSNNEFDDLYDISEGEEEVTDIPISISLANSPVLARNAFSIPSPSIWPSIHRKVEQTQMFDHSLLSVASPKIQINRLSQYSAQTPSLDGSLTSDELNSISCPSTPDVSSAEEDPSEWTMPTQLNPDALLTLARLTVSQQDSQQMEMSERGAGLQKLNTSVKNALEPIEEGELSALSIPSPGGFFSSLNSSSRSTWEYQPTEQVTSTVAETFYGRPFDLPPRDSSNMQTPTGRPQYIDLNIDNSDALTEGPPTARQIPVHWSCGTPGLQALKSPDYFTGLQDYNENYERRLVDQSSSNIDRTSNWLASQDCTPVDEDVEQSATDIEEESMLIPDFPEVPAKHEPIEESLQDQTFVQGFTHLQNNKSNRDTFVHRKTRTEKLRLDRKCLFSNHMSQLEGKYTLASPPPTATKHVFDPEPAPEEVAEKLALETAMREQSALEQMQPAAWAVEATKFLNGGTLLTSPVSKVFEKFPNPRILDLGGVASCDWAWQVAIDYPTSTVHTVYGADSPVDEYIATPKNHKQTAVPNLWTLPYPSGHFDCVSARNLHALLKLTRPKTSQRIAPADEFDLTLRECMRVLRPGGYLEFALLDADIMSAGHYGRSMNARVTSSLYAHGYDAAPTKNWLNRVRRAGFGQIRRAWLVLPMSQYGGVRDGTTANASHISGMVGGWAWERWLAKLQKEVGNGEDLLNGVADVMEEGARTGAGWRYLSGWARKPL
jgi:hypothetical protein